MNNCVQSALHSLDHKNSSAWIHFICLSLPSTYLDGALKGFYSQINFCPGKILPSCLLEPWVQFMLHPACGPCTGELLFMTWGYAEYLVKSLIQFDEE